MRKFASPCDACQRCAPGCGSETRQYTAQRYIPLVSHGVGITHVYYGLDRAENCCDGRANKRNLVQETWFADHGIQHPTQLFLQLLEAAREIVGSTAAVARGTRLRPNEVCAGRNDAAEAGDYLLNTILALSRKLEGEMVQHTGHGPWPISSSGALEMLSWLAGAVRAFACFVKALRPSTKAADDCCAVATAARHRIEVGRMENRILQVLGSL